jgi:mono/diheme cytochrome c family protein
MSAVRRTLLGAVVVAAIVAAGVAWFLRGPGPMAFANGSNVALADFKGPNPTGVPASLAGESLIQRGEYLAHAADCMVCHTTRGGKPYAGGLAFKLPFGELYSTNITPDKETGIGNYSDRDFLNAVQHGTRRDGAPLYPAMPYTSYSYLTDDDALAIKAYLFGLAPVRVAAPENTLAFPFNQRWAMVFWSTLFNRDVRFEPNAQQSAEWNRGAYLAEALAHCGECHTPRNLAFALDNRKKFGGALTAGWRAFNISSDKTTGLGDWHDEDLVSYLSIGHATGHGTASGPMGEAVDESFSRLAPEDIHALVTFLRSVPAIGSTDLPATRAPPASPSHKVMAGTPDPHGKTLFEGACVSCHGWTGESAISPFATFTGAWAVNDPGATNVAQIVISGTTRRSPPGAVSMPAFGAAYSDTEIAAVTNYVTARFGTKASAITANDVAELRKQTSQ